jgi:hypothetical protein
MTDFIDPVPANNTERFTTGVAVSLAMSGNKMKSVESGGILELVNDRLVLTQPCLMEPFIITTANFKWMWTVAECSSFPLARLATGRKKYGNPNPVKAREAKSSSTRTFKIKE